NVCGVAVSVAGARIAEGLQVTLPETVGQGFSSTASARASAAACNSSTMARAVSATLRAATASAIAASAATPAACISSPLVSGCGGASIAGGVQFTPPKMVGQGF